MDTVRSNYPILALAAKSDITSANAYQCITSRPGIATSPGLVLSPLPASKAAVIANRLESQGDILLALQDALTVVDIAVVHQVAAAYVDAATHSEGTAAAVRDQANCEQYDNSDPLGYACVLLSTESFGGLGKPATALVNQVAGCASVNGVVFEGTSVVNASRKLSVGLCRGIVCCTSGGFMRWLV